MEVFLGLDTFGRSTLVSIVSIDESKKSLILDKLANYFIEKYGAPNLHEAKKVAKEEINFMRQTTP